MADMRGKVYEGVVVDILDGNHASMDSFLVRYPAYSYTGTRMKNVYHNIPRLREGGDLDIGTRVRVVVGSMSMMKSIRILEDKPMKTYEKYLLEEERNKKKSG